MQTTWRRGNRWYYGWELPVLLFLIAMAIIAPTMWYVPLAVTIGLLGVRRITSGRFVPSTPINLLLLVIVVLAVLSAFVFQGALPSGKLTNLLLGIALFYALTQYMRDSNSGIIHVLLAVLVIGLVMAVIGLLSASWPPPFEFVSAALDRIMPDGIQAALNGVAVGANELAGVLGWVTPLMVALSLGTLATLRQQQPWIYRLLVVLTGFFVITIVATASRGGIMALAIGVGLILALLVEPRFRLVVAITMAMTIAAIYFTYSNPQIDNQMVEDAVGLRGRMEIWSRGFETLRDFPLTGVGFNSFRTVVPLAYPLFHTAPSVDIAHSHNQLLQTGLDLGIPGLVAYLATWLLAALLLIQALVAMNTSRQQGLPYWAITVGLAGSLVTSWTFGAADAVALGAKPGFLWWALLALIVSIHHDVVVRKVGLASRRRQSRRSAGTDDVQNVIAPEPENVPAVPERLLPPAPFQQPSSPRVPIPRPHGERPPLSRPRGDSPPK